MKTSIENVRKISKLLSLAVRIEPDAKFGIVQHPFTNHTAWMNDRREFVDIATEDGYKQWSEVLEKHVDSGDLTKIYIMVTTAWKLTWLKFVKPYLSNRDFSEFLANAWVDEENPNMDVNVPTATAIKWFKEANKRVLMDEEEYEYCSNLPETVTLYRGVAKGRKKYGISWTDDKEKAIWFKNRWATDEKEGMLLRVVVPKKHCLCYLNRRNEKEIVLNVHAIKKDIEDITNLDI